MPAGVGGEFVREKPGEFTSTSMVNDMAGLTIHSMSFTGLSVFTTDWFLDSHDLTLTGDITFLSFYDQDGITDECRPDGRWPSERALDPTDTRVPRR